MSKEKVPFGKVVRLTGFLAIVVSSAMKLYRRLTNFFDSIECKDICSSKHFHLELNLQRTFICHRQSSVRVPGCLRITILVTVESIQNSTEYLYVHTWIITSILH